MTRKGTNPLPPKTGNMPKIGDRVRDVVTGFAGIIVGETHWITGCTTYGVQPDALDKDGKMPEAQWFDPVRLEVVQAAAVPTARPKDDGGPIPSTPREGNPTP